MQIIDRLLRRHPCPGCRQWTDSPVCRLCHQAARLPHTFPALLNSQSIANQLVRHYRETGNHYIETWLIQLLCRRIRSASTVWTTPDGDPLLTTLLHQLIRTRPESALMHPSRHKDWPLACRLLSWKPLEESLRQPMIQAISIQLD
jgi:hypothetical protein